MSQIIEVLKQIFEVLKVAWPFLLELFKLFKQAPKQAAINVKTAREIK